LNANLGITIVMNRLKNYTDKYFEEMNKKLTSVDISELNQLTSLIIKTHKNGKKIIIVGNGGSASIASHLVVDFINAATIKAISFNDPSMITCFANDYGYENWVSRALGCYSEAGDLVILISSSGQSKNMLIGAKKAKSMNVGVVTFTGFLPDNPLRLVGDINLWVDSGEYNIVEMTHHVWLLAVVDYIIENKSDI